MLEPKSVAAANADADADQIRMLCSVYECVCVCVCRCRWQTLKSLVLIKGNLRARHLICSVSVWVQAGRPVGTPKWVWEALIKI